MQRVENMRQRQSLPDHACFGRAAWLAAWLLSALQLGGCAASPRIISQWTNTSYGPASFKRIVVIAVTDETSVRRNFEDKLVAKLRAAAVDAVPSYRYLPENMKADNARLEETVRRAGADAALITRLLRVEQRTQVESGYYDPPPALGLYHWYSSAWYGFYRPPRVYHYEAYVTETTLYDTVKNEVVWTATIRTIAPDDLSEAMDEYIEAVVNALKGKNLLRA
jgi:hypothetical protein